ncbi:MAG: hypothetical protein ISQ52_09195 [Synechococcus sp. BS307-5m-G38]|nr:hypothetical protein [Synechococcus sp. BS307-5m-G38]
MSVAMLLGGGLCRVDAMLVNVALLAVAALIGVSPLVWVILHSSAG